MHLSDVLKKLNVPEKKFNVVIDTDLKLNLNTEDEFEVDFERVLLLLNTNAKIFAFEGEMAKAAV